MTTPSLVEELLRPYLLDAFRRTHFHRSPLGLTGSASRLEGLLTWRLLDEIFHSGHADCWLPRYGRLPELAAAKTGRLSGVEARAAFAGGRTVLVRHAERAHAALEAIAAPFRHAFQRPVDVQLYATPANEIGFYWHYDVEEVFVIQSAGSKTFSMRDNTVAKRPYAVPLPVDLEYERERSTRKMECRLNAGDVLYIPSGMWHTARAVTDSFHLSIGVLSLPEA